MVTIKYSTSQVEIAITSGTATSVGSILRNPQVRAQLGLPENVSVNISNGGIVLPATYDTVVSDGSTILCELTAQKRSN